MFESFDRKIFRTNYFEVFPIVYPMFTGFSQVEKLKIRVVVAYEFAEAA